MDQNPITVISAPKKRTKAEKTSIAIVISIGSVLLALIFYLSGVFSFFGVRLYKGDRITGEMTITLNGKECFPTSANAFFDDSELTVTLDKSSFALKGGEQGLYVIDFILDRQYLYQLTGERCFAEMTDDLRIVLKYPNKKWYYITEMEISVTLVYDGDGLDCVINADYIADNAERYKVFGKYTKPLYLPDLIENSIIELVIGN